MPEVHVCSRLTDENNQLIRKLKKLKKRNNTVEEELREINEKLKFENFVKENTLKVHTCTQTDVPGYKPLVVRPKPTNQQLNKKDDQQKQIDSLLKMHKSLMKKYQRELKSNSKHLETIAALNLRIQQLEDQLSNANQRIDMLQNRSQTPASVRRRRTPRSQRRRGCSPHLDDSLDLKTEVKHLKHERDKLSKEKKLLKKELGALDDDFFEEIEDLKFALQQSAKLNQEYQKTLDKLSKQFGFPLPRISCSNSGKKSRKT